MAYARVSTYEFEADRLDEARPAFEEATKNLGQMQGITEAMFLVDRAEGKAITITIWESEEALRASEQPAEEVRQRGAASGGGQITGVARYEIVLRETF